jgi:hypothetical protein
MRLGFLAGLLAACAALSVAPAQAAGADGDRAAPVGFFFLEASNGYQALVATLDRSVILEVQRGNVAAAYLVRGRVNGDGIRARFGNLGEIAVDFEPLGGERRRSNRCMRRARTDIGFFRGRIQFRGEDGYTAVKESRALGLFVEPRPKRCNRSSAGSSAVRGPSLNTYLSAISRQKGTVTSFALSRKRGNDLLSLTAVHEERRGAMQILRLSSTTVGGANAFAASGPGVRPPFAFIAAPKPFSGSAVLDAGAAPGSQWTGTLAAWLPGAGKVALAGSEFATSFCRRAADEQPCNPEALVRRPFLAQGSGSQSQLFGEARLSWSRYLRNSANSAGSTP